MWHVRCVVHNDLEIRVRPHFIKCRVVKKRGKLGVFHEKQEKSMKSSTKNQTAGVYHEAKGKIKETVGKITDNPTLEAEGLAEKVAGQIQKKVGQAERVLEE